MSVQEHRLTQIVESLEKLDGVQAVTARSKHRGNVSVRIDGGPSLNPDTFLERCATLDVIHERVPDAEPNVIGERDGFVTFVVPIGYQVPASDVAGVARCNDGRTTVGGS